MIRYNPNLDDFVAWMQARQATHFGQALLVESGLPEAPRKSQILDTDELQPAMVFQDDHGFPGHGFLRLQ